MIRRQIDRVDQVPALRPGVGTHSHHQQPNREFLLGVVDEPEHYEGNRRDERRQGVEDFAGGTDGKHITGDEFIGDGCSDNPGKEQGDVW